MFNVTPIGSCRITGPLRHGQANHGIGLNLSRCYGYCHSPAEAVQMAHFMQGAVEIPQDIWPLVSRSSTQHEMAMLDCKPSDLYVVELASAKEITIDGVSIQLNYLNATYREFFADPQRAQDFWASAELDDREPLARFLEKNWAGSADQLEDAEVLKRIRLRFVTRDSLWRDIQTLVNMLPNVMFVTHVDARKPDGQRIGSRSRFIQLVREEVANASFYCFDPTELMHEFGQNAAIEDHSTSLAHFTPEFTESIMDRWMDDVIAPLSDEFVRANPTERAISAVTSQVLATQVSGRHAASRERLESLSSELDHFDELLTQTRERQDAHRENLTASLKSLDKSDETAVAALVARAAAAGHTDLVLRVLETLPDGATVVPNRTIMPAMRQALASGDDEAAFKLAHVIFERDPEFAPAAQALENQLIERPVMAFAALSEAKKQDLLAVISPLHRLEVLHVQRLPITLAITPATSQSTLSSMVSFLSERERIEDAIALMAALRKWQDIDRYRDKLIVELLSNWIAAAVTLTDPRDRVEVMAAIMEADPKHSSVRKALQDLKKDFIRRARAAGKSGDAATLEAMRGEADLFPFPLPEFEFWRARLRFNTGDFSSALQIGSSVAELIPENINLWVLLMRCAVRLQLTGEANDFAERVINLASPKTEKLKTEAESVLELERMRA